MLIKIKNIPCYGELYEEITLDLKDSFYFKEVIYDKPNRYTKYCWKITLYFFFSNLVFSTKEKCYDY